MANEESPAQRFRILCVDDEPWIRDLLRLLLQRAGYSVETAADGQDAWETLSRDLTAFDLVITDNEMPKLSGLALVERLRDAGFTRNVVMFSASVLSQAGDRLQRLNIAAVVKKGRPVTELMEQIRRIETEA